MPYLGRIMTRGYRSLALALCFIFFIFCFCRQPAAAGSEQASCEQTFQQMIALMNKGKYRESLPLGEQCLASAEKLYGPNHAQTFNCMVSLGFAYKSIGEYAQSNIWYKRCLDLIANNPLINQEYKAGVLGSMAETSFALGEYTQAERLYNGAKDIIDQHLGREHPKAVMNLQGLGTVYIETGEYAKAESSCKRALALAEQSFGRAGFEVAQSLSCLGKLYEKIGDYAKAEHYHQQSITNAGKTNPEIIAGFMDRLALIYYSTGKHAKAIVLYEQSLQLKEKSIGGEHPEVVSTLNNLGMCYDGIGNRAKARALYQRSLAITQKNLGENAASLTAPLNNLAVLHLQEGEYATAEALTRRALAIKEIHYGKNFHQSIYSLYSLALIMTLQGRYEAAWEQLQRVNRIDDQLIQEVFGFTSEKQKMAYLARTTRGINLTLRVLTHLTANQQAVQAGFNLWLKRKGLVLETQKQFQDALFRSQDPETLDIFNRLTAVRTQLSALILAGPDNQGLAAYQHNIAGLEAQKELMEGQLTTRNQGFALQSKKAKADYRQVARALPPGSILVDFARIDSGNLGAGKAAEPARYLAFLLAAGTESEVTLVDLGEAEPIEKVLSELKETLGNRKKTPASPETAQTVTTLSSSLYNLVFKPLRPHFGPSKVIFLSPDGRLNLLPFEILSDPTAGQFLVEQYTFNYIATGRDLLSFGQLQGKAGKNLIMGNPDYNLDQSSRLAIVQQLNLKASNQGQPAALARGLDSLHFTPLPGTLQEVAAIRAILGNRSSEFFVGKEAVEEVLTSRPAPRILHLATHGFYLDDQQVRRPEAVAGATTKAKPQPNPGKTADNLQDVPRNPLVRSGLALAGANTALTVPQQEQQDGLVTAEKILNLNLLGTDLVVLSACESGLGEVKSGEGVFGLRRAFSQAGAKSMVMSMWPVPDQETKELMTAFYINIQIGAMDRAQALRHAVLDEMATVKQRYGHANPFFWGAFIFAGEP